MFNILVAGPGAVGQVIGGSLARSHTVTFLGREGSQRIDDINQKGVRIDNLRFPKQSFTVQAKAVASLDGWAPADLVLLTTKTYSNDRVLPKILPVVTHNTIFLSLQNGVTSANQMQKMFRMGSVLGAFCFMGAAVLPSGIIELNSPERVIVGDLNKRSSDALSFVMDIFTEVGISITQSENIDRDLWIKLLWNVGIFQWCAFEGKTIGELLSDESSLQQVRGTMLEAVNIAQANHVSITREDIQTQINTALTKYAPVTPSLLQDLRAQRPLELGSFAGFISSEGQRLGIQVPYNDFLFEELTRLSGNY